MGEFDHVINRHGEKEPAEYDKIKRQIEELSHDLGASVDPHTIIKMITDGLTSGITTFQISQLAADIAASLITDHYNYDKLATRLIVTSMHKNTPPKFSEFVEIAAADMEDKLVDYVRSNADALDAIVSNALDFEYTYFGLRTIMQMYLHTQDGKLIERPQYMILRVCTAIHLGNMQNIRESYQYMSNGYFTHASPTLFNAGFKIGGLSSCFLLTMREDSIDGIYKTLNDTAIISKNGGGVGLSVSKIRAKGSRIAGTRGVSSGLIPMLKVFNSTARYVDQGGNRRPGAFAIYIEPWHADIFDVLRAKLNTTDESQRTPDLFYGLWVPDLFMRRVFEDGEWSLMTPDACPGLSTSFGTDFEDLYMKYESEGRYVKRIRAADLMNEIVRAQIETGTPYMLYKDKCNLHNQQANIGTLELSNLCTEILEHVGDDEQAVCNLASICLPKFVVDKVSNGVSRRVFDFDMFRSVVRVVVANLNIVVDKGSCPNDMTKRSNTRNRPIGVGVQGLADTFALFGYTFESADAIALNKLIFEHMYHDALEMSCDLAKEFGAYESYETGSFKHMNVGYSGSPASVGMLQMDFYDNVELSMDWAPLRQSIKDHGLRNSLLIALMPTASTSGILGNSECFEPFSGMIYSRRVLAGEYKMVNKLLVSKLEELDLWDNDVKNDIIAANGSIQHLPYIPLEVKNIFKTVWEISNKTVVRMAMDRMPFIDQSQSMSLHLRQPTPPKVRALHKLAFEAGLKTGMYYLRTRAAAAPIKFTIRKKRAVVAPVQSAVRECTPECTSCSL